jgi:hypothetical protein
LRRVPESKFAGARSRRTGRREADIS